MITSFGSLFAGHVDFGDDIGLDATPVNGRWLSDERLAGVFDKGLAIAQTMDRLGLRHVLDGRAPLPAGRL